MALTLACAIACGVLVVAEYLGFARLRIASKLAASAAFVMLALPAIGGDDFARFMFVGLVFGAIGDVALLGHGSRAFLVGLGAFLVGHLMYVAGIAQITPPSRWLGDAGWLAVLPIGGGIAMLVVMWKRLGALRMPVIWYVVAIVAMVVAALAAFRSVALPDPQRGYLVIGAMLFFVSDLAVARDRFLTRGFSNRLWGLPTYYASQLLIAWSIL